jgi:GDP-L-fucose synthase
MKIVVTGGTGFLGKNVVALLKSENHDVFSISKEEGVDILNYEKFLAKLDEIKPEMLIHCAAHVGGIAYNELHPVEVFEDNTHIGLNVVKACNEVGIKYFVNIMPNCTYPGNMNEYQEEKWWDGPMHDTVLTYGLPRKMVFGSCFAYCKKNSSFKPIHLIFPNMYGPGDHFEIIRSHALGALISKIIDAKESGKKSVDIWGTGKPVREWLYVRDGAESILKAIENINKFEPNEIMNIGIRKGVSIKEMAEIIKEIVEWEGDFVYQPEKPDGAMKKILVAEKMKQKLKWEPPTDLKDGIKETVKWYHKNILKK